MNDNKIAALIFGEGDKNIKHIEKLLNLRINARGNILYIIGENAYKAKNIIESLIDYAKDNSIIILGVSPKNSIMKYFFGSKPLSIAQKCNCPVLITK